MYRFRILFKMEGHVIIEAESEEEAKEAFYNMDPNEIAGNTYSQVPDIDDIYCEEILD